ncbi:MAG: chromophore lyase CpcT/CpeT [Candidatus Sulfomarinibacteraceae bacterium]
MSWHWISPPRRAPVAVILCATIGLAFAVGADDETKDLDVLAEWMTGSFSSAAQAAEDPEFFDVDLHITPVWTDRGDGRWLYVEQAVADAPDLPYRQRVYRVTEVAPGLFENRVYTLPDPGAVTGAWREEAPLDDLSPDDLEEREGCSIVMRRRGNTFIGSTLGWLCTSSLRGATYQTSDVMITPDGMISWDRGFAEDNRQVWGSVVGGTVFDRIVEDPKPDPASASESATDSDSDSEETTEAKEIAPEQDVQPE